MKCQNCGTEFEEGLFCPECGTKWIESDIDKKNLSDENSDQENEDALRRANAILEEYNDVEVEEEKIKNLGWNNSIDDAERVRIRMKQLEEAEKLELKTSLGQKKIQEMRSDLKQDYLKIKKDTLSVPAAIITTVVGSILCMYFLLPYGTVKKVIGIVIIIGLVNNIYEAWKNQKILREIETFWQRKKM